MNQNKTSNELEKGTEVDIIVSMQGRERRNSLPPLPPPRIPPLQPLSSIAPLPTTPLPKSSSSGKPGKQPSRPNSRGLSSSLSGYSQIPDLDAYMLLQKKEGYIAQEEQGVCFPYKFIPPKEVDQLPPVVSVTHTSLLTH